MFPETWEHWVLYHTLMMLNDTDDYLPWCTRKAERIGLPRAVGESMRGECAVERFPDTDAGRAARLRAILPHMTRWSPAQLEGVGY